MLSGELLMCGSMNWDLVGRKALPKGSKSCRSFKPGEIVLLSLRSLYFKFIRHNEIRYFGPKNSILKMNEYRSERNLMGCQ